MILLWLLLGFALGYQLANRALVGRFQRYELEVRPRMKPEYAVSHLKTIHGCQPRSETNWRSYIDQDYLGPTEVVFTAGRPGDPALEVARGIAASDPRIKVIEGDSSGLGVNPKVANMIQGFPHCTQEIILSSDSDVFAPPQYMDKVMECFEDPQVGLVTCLYCIQRVNSPALALEALSVLDFSTSVLVARALEGMSFGLGANLVMRRQALEQIGGLEALADYLAEDYQVGNRMHRAGWKVKLAGVVVEDVVPGMTFRDYFFHQLRWMRTYRISRPGGHFAYIVTQGALWSTLLLLLQGGAAGWAAFLTWWGVRLNCTAQSWRILGGQRVTLWIGWLILKDYFYLLLWALSLRGNRVRWGPRELELSPNGKVRLVRWLDGRA